MTRPNQPDLEDVLDLLVMEYEAPSRAAVLDFVGRYPRYATEIVEFAAAWAEQSALPEPVPLAPEREAAVASRSLSFAANYFYERDAARAAANGEAVSASAEASGAATLAELARSVGLGMAELARGCRVSLSLLAKLNNRLVQPHTVDSRLAAMAAGLLSVAPERVRASWTGPPRMATGAAYLSKGKPETAAQVSFSDAITSSGLSPEDLAFWRGEA